MIDKKLTNYLQNRRNLLAFSAGADSTALFFLLLEREIPFDIAIVDYNVRRQSKEEVAYAKQLALCYDKQCFVHEAPKIKSNFEATARQIRYDFFEELIRTHRYDTLISAHHLGDNLEWFLMQFLKGAGTVELCGMKHIEHREGYELVRPLLEHDKEELKEYLHARDIRYFHDSSNDDHSYTRNRIRHRFATQLLQENKEGIRRSFAYLREDADALVSTPHSISCDAMLLFQSTSARSDMVHVDRYLKQKGMCITAYEKEQLKKRLTTVLGRKWVVAFTKELVVVTPYIHTGPTLPKEFKERCRKLKIEPKMRPWLFEHEEAFELLCEELAKSQAPKA